MLATDLELFHNAIRLANSGQKSLAYQQLLALYQASADNQHDASLVLWLAFTTADLTEAEQAINWAASLAPNDPNVQSARQWLANEKAKLAYTANAQTPRLDPEQALLAFKRDFAYYCQDSIITQEEWDTLVRSAALNGLKLEDALTYIRPEAFGFISHTIDLAAEDGFISYDEERNIQHLISLLAMPPNLATPLEQRLQWLKTLTQIRQGELPVIKPQIAIPPGELARFEVKALIENAPTSATPAWLIATSRNLIYIGNADGFEMNLQNISEVTATANKIQIQLDAPFLVRNFMLGDAPMVKAAIEALVKLKRRASLAKDQPAGAIAPSAVETTTKNQPANRRHTPSPIEENFLKTWQLYNDQQTLKIPLVSEYGVLDGHYFVDFAHPATKTAIELDGFQAHSSTEQIARDRRREREIRAAGWEFIRFGGKEVNGNVYGCVIETYQFIHSRLNPEQATTYKIEEAPPPAMLNAEYRPDQTKILFIEEYNISKGVRNFYRANSRLFHVTREIFTEYFKTEWQTPEEFLKFFKEQGCYITALDDQTNGYVESDILEKARKEAVAGLAKRLKEIKPKQVAVIMGGITPYVKQAIEKAGLKLGPVEVLPFPGKEYEAGYKEKLLKILARVLPQK